MIQNYSRWKVLGIFFDDPNPLEGFTIRGIAKLIKLAPTSVKMHLDGLIKDNFVIKAEGRTYETYWANRENPLFRFYKKIDMQVRLEESKLIEFVWDVCNPQVVILFGSSARGEDDKMSDIDLFVMAKERTIALEKYEKSLKRKIQLHFSDNFQKLPRELKNNILNGIIIKGYIKVF
jgi:predicted nucleotidyltransferase